MKPTFQQKRKGTCAISLTRGHGKYKQTTRILCKFLPKVQCSQHLKSMQNCSTLQCRIEKKLTMNRNIQQEKLQVYMQRITAIHIYQKDQCGFKHTMKSHSSKILLVILSIFLKIASAALIAQHIIH